MKRLTHEEFVEEIQQINSLIEILGEYKGCHAKIKVRCKVCGYEWETTPYILLKNCSCQR